MPTARTTATETFLASARSVTMDTYWHLARLARVDSSYGSARSLIPDSSLGPARSTATETFPFSAFPVQTGQPNSSGRNTFSWTCPASSARPVIHKSGVGRFSICRQRSQK